MRDPYILAGCARVRARIHRSVAVGLAKTPERDAATVRAFFTPILEVVDALPDASGVWRLLAELRLALEDALHEEGLAVRIGAEGVQIVRVRT